MPASDSIAKVRADAWDAHLTDVQRWAAFEQFRRAPWHEVAAWAKAEFGLARLPGRAAMYRWAARMRKLESAHRVEQAILARDEVDGLAAGAALDSDRLIEAYKSLAADLAMRLGDAAGASTYTRMALDLAAAQTKRAELALRERAQQTKDAALDLARQKFEAAEARLAAASSTVADDSLTPEQRQARLKEIFGLK
jgi:plasmid maintenance system antidote protein VapI